MSTQVVGVRLIMSTFLFWISCFAFALLESRGFLGCTVFMRIKRNCIFFFFPGQVRSHEDQKKMREEYWIVAITLKSRKNRS